MKRRLILMRHAKSAWHPAMASDHARPLNERGRRDAPRVARALLDRGWVPDFVSSSDAERTQETWRCMQPVLGAVPATFDRRLYHAGLNELRHVADAWDDALTTALTLGHNPGWSAALCALSGKGLDMTTANAALLRGEGETWSAALTHPWTLEVLLRPRELDGDAE